MRPDQGESSQEACLWTKTTADSAAKSLCKHSLTSSKGFGGGQDPGFAVCSYSGGGSSLQGRRQGSASRALGIHVRAGQSREPAEVPMEQSSLAKDLRSSGLRSHCVTPVPVLELANSRRLSAQYSCSRNPIDVSSSASTGSAGQAQPLLSTKGDSLHQTRLVAG